MGAGLGTKDEESGLWTRTCNRQSSSGGSSASNRESNGQSYKESNEESDSARNGRSDFRSNGSSNRGRNLPSNWPVCCLQHTVYYPADHGPRTPGRDSRDSSV